MDPSLALSRVRTARAQGGARRAIELSTLLLNQGPPESVELDARLERARSYSSQGEWARAEVDCRRVLAGRADAEATLLLAECLLEQKRGSEALSVLEAGRTGRCTSAWWALYARALSAEKRHAEACDAAERAHQLDHASLVLRLQVLAGAGRHPELIDLARQALEVECSARARAEMNTLLGLSLDALGHSREAAAALREAVSLEPERIDTNCGLGMALLRIGEYEAGFRHYEFRQNGTGRPRLGVPPWRGEPLDGKHLVVRFEQGYGDTLQFARFLKLARERAERTTFFAPPSLVRLLRSNPGLGEIATGHPGFGFGDFQTLVMSLPLHLGLTGLPDVAAAPYLFAEPELVASWRRRLASGARTPSGQTDRRSRVALAWQGNPHYAGDPWRSMPFEHYGPLIQRFGDRLQFLSLQKGTGREQLQASPLADRVLDLADEVDGAGNAFVDSLAVLSEVDLFITTDNGLAHLACAGGVRTWLLLGTVPDWRWSLSGETTPWYPSARLFRQTSGGDWRGLIGRVSEELERELSKT